MEQTNFFEFNLPEYSDSVDIEKINENTAKMDQALMAGLCTKTSTGSSIGDGTMAGSPKAWAPYFEIKNENNVDVVVTDRNYGESLVTYTVEAGKTFRKYINGIYRMNFTVADSYEVEFKYFVDAQTAIDEIQPSGGGSVTSVAVQGYNGSHITATGSPITSSGTITLNVAAGYSIPSDEDQTAWSGKQNAIDSDHKISADNVDDASATNKFTNATEKQTWNAKAADIKFEINSSTYVITAQLKDSSGNLIGTEKTIDLPLETMVVSGTYDDTTEKIVLTLKNGQTVEFSVAALVSGLQTELSSSNKLDPSYIAYDSTHAAVTDADKAAYAAKYDKPSTGIPSSDMSSAVQTSLGLADSALQTETDPTVPSWAKQQNKPTYTADELNMKTGYAADTAEASITASSTVNDAVEQLDYRTAANKTNILSIENRLNNIHYAPVYGFRIKKGTESDPTAMVEYLYDAVGMTPASMNFTTGEFDYGSWGDLWFVKNNKPVALNFDGTEAFELSPTDWWKKADGTTDSGLEDESSTYNFMARMPLVYVNRWEDANYNYVAISEQPVNTGFLAQAHTGLNGTINSNIYLPMFKGYIDSCTTAGTINTAGKLRSIGGAWISAGTSAEEEIRAANNIAGANSGWQLVAHSQRCLIQDLLTLISKSADAIGKFGNGDISTYNTSGENGKVHIGSVTNHPNNGKLKSAYEQDNTTKAACAQFKGYNDSIHHVTAFFMQDPWGNRWDRTPGLNRINRTYKTKMIPPYTSNGNSDSTYLTASIQTPSAEGWLKTISSTNQFGNLPEAVGAAETTFFKSYFYTNSNTDEKLALVGGSGAGAKCSPRYVHLSHAGSFRYWGIGGSPCFVSP